MGAIQVSRGCFPRVLPPWRGIMVLLATLIPAAGPAFGAPEPQPISPQAEEIQRSPRLAPLGLEKLMDLEVTSVTRKESTVGESAAAVSVISQEDIRRSGATTIAELFRRVPGMDVARIDTNKWAISARGFNDRFANKLLVQRDGRTLYDPIFAGVYWNAVDYPLEDIERIEVIRGPGASLWGANAVNGIINIITKSGENTHGGLLGAGGGTPEGGFGALRYGGTIGPQADYRAYAKGFERDTQFSRQGDTHDRWNGASTGMRLDWRLNGLDTVTLQGDYLHSEAGRQDPDLQRTPPFITLMADRTVAESGNVLGRWTHRRDEQNSWSLQAYWARFNTTQPAADISFNNDSYDLDFQQQFPLGERHKLVYGLEYRFVNQSVGNSLSDGGLSVAWIKSTFPLATYSAFLQDEYAVFPGLLRLLLGFKLEHNDFTGAEFEPAARLLWTPTGRQTIWAAVSRAVGTPSISEEGIQLSALPPTRLPSGVQVFPRVTGNPGLSSVKLTAYELGYRAQVAEPLSLDCALFFNQYDGLVVSVPQPLQSGFAPGTAIVPLLFENRMDGETYGAEIAADWRPARWWRLYGTYSFLEMNLYPDRTLPAAARADAQGAEGRSPRHQAYLQSSFNLPRSLELDIMGRYVGALPGFTEEIPAYFALDARVAWRPRANLEVAVVGQNLLDDHHPEFGVSSIIAAPIAEIRRNVYAKLTWWF